MAGAIMDKVWGLFGGVEPEDTDEYDDEDVYEYEDKGNYDNEEEERKFFGKKGKVVPLTSNQSDKSRKLLITNEDIMKNQMTIQSLKAAEIKKKPQAKFFIKIIFIL